MMLGISQGGRLLTAEGQAPLVVLWVVLIAGTHFHPFARAFGAPVFRQLAYRLMDIAVMFAGLFLLGWSAAPSASAAVAGAALMWFSAGPAGHRPASGAHHTL